VASCVDVGEKGALRHFVWRPVPGSPRRPPSLTRGVAPVPSESAEGDGDEEREGSGVEGGSTAVTLNSKAWACVTGGKDWRGEATVSPWPLQGRPAMTELAKIVPERGALKLEPVPRPVKGEPGVLRGRVWPNSHDSDVVLKS